MAITIKLQKLFQDIRPLAFREWFIEAIKDFIVEQKGAADKKADYEINTSDEQLLAIQQAVSVFNAYFIDKSEVKIPDAKSFLQKPMTDLVNSLFEGMAAPLSLNPKMRIENFGQSLSEDVVKGISNDLVSFNQEVSRVDAEVKIYCQKLTEYFPKIIPKSFYDTYRLALIQEGILRKKDLEGYRFDEVFERIARTSLADLEKATGKVPTETQAELNLTLKLKLHHTIGCSIIGDALDADIIRGTVRYHQFIDIIKGNGKADAILKCLEDEKIKERSIKYFGSHGLQSTPWDAKQRAASFLSDLVSLSTDEDWRIQAFIIRSLTGVAPQLEDIGESKSAEFAESMKMILTQARKNTVLPDVLDQELKDKGLGDKANYWKAAEDYVSLFEVLFPQINDSENIRKFVTYAIRQGWKIDDIRKRAQEKLREIAFVHPVEEKSVEGLLDNPVLELLKVKYNHQVIVNTTLSTLGNPRFDEIMDVLRRRNLKPIVELLLNYPHIADVVKRNLARENPWTPNISAARKVEYLLDQICASKENDGTDLVEKFQEVFGKPDKITFMLSISEPLIIQEAAAKCSVFLDLKKIADAKTPEVAYIDIDARVMAKVERYVNVMNRINEHFQLTKHLENHREFIKFMLAKGIDLNKSYNFDNNYDMDKLKAIVRTELKDIPNLLDVTKEGDPISHRLLDKPLDLQDLRWIREFAFHNGVSEVHLLAEVNYYLRDLEKIFPGLDNKENLDLVYYPLVQGWDVDKFSIYRKEKIEAIKNADEKTIKSLLEAKNGSADDAKKFGDPVLEQLIGKLSPLQIIGSPRFVEFLSVITASGNHEIESLLQRPEIAKQVKEKFGQIPAADWEKAKNRIAREIIDSLCQLPTNVDSNRITPVLQLHLGINHWSDQDSQFLNTHKGMILRDAGNSLFELDIPENQKAIEMIRTHVKRHASNGKLRSLLIHILNQPMLIPELDNKFKEVFAAARYYIDTLKRLFSIDFERVNPYAHENLALEFFKDPHWDKNSKIHHVDEILSQIAVAENHNYHLDIDKIIHDNDTQSRMLLFCKDHCANYLEFRGYARFNELIKHPVISASPTSDHHFLGGLLLHPSFKNYIIKKLESVTPWNVQKVVNNLLIQLNNAKDIVAVKAILHEQLGIPENQISFSPPKFEVFKNDMQFLDTMNRTNVNHKNDLLELFKMADRKKLNKFKESKITSGQFSESLASKIKNAKSKQSFEQIFSTITEAKFDRDPSQAKLVDNAWGQLQAQRLIDEARTRGDFILAKLLEENFDSTVNAILKPVTISIGALSAGGAQFADSIGKVNELINSFNIPIDELAGDQKGAADVPQKIIDAMLAVGLMNESKRTHPMKLTPHENNIGLQLLGEVRFNKILEIISRVQPSQPDIVKFFRDHAMNIKNILQDEKVFPTLKFNHLPNLYSSVAQSIGLLTDPLKLHIQAISNNLQNSQMMNDFIRGAIEELKTTGFFTEELVKDFGAKMLFTLLKDEAIINLCQAHLNAPKNAIEAIKVEIVNRIANTHSYGEFCHNVRSLGLPVQNNDVMALCVRRATEAKTDELLLNKLTPLVKIAQDKLKESIKTEPPAHLPEMTSAVSVLFNLPKDLRENISDYLKDKDAKQTFAFLRSLRADGIQVGQNSPRKLSDYVNVLNGYHIDNAGEIATYLYAEDSFERVMLSLAPNGLPAPAHRDLYKQMNEPNTRVKILESLQAGTITAEKLLRLLGTDPRNKPKESVVTVGKSPNTAHITYHADQELRRRTILNALRSSELRKLLIEKGRVLGTENEFAALRQFVRSTNAYLEDQSTKPASVSAVKTRHLQAIHQMYESSVNDQDVFVCFERSGLDALVQDLENCISTPVVTVTADVATERLKPAKELCEKLDQKHDSKHERAGLEHDKQLISNLYHDFVRSMNSMTSSQFLSEYNIKKVEEIMSLIERFSKKIQKDKQDLLARLKEVEDLQATIDQGKLQTINEIEKQRNELSHLLETCRTIEEQIDKLRVSIAPLVGLNRDKQWVEGEVFEIQESIDVAMRDQKFIERCETIKRTVTQSPKSSVSAAASLEPTPAQSLNNIMRNINWTSVDKNKTIIQSFAYKTETEEHGIKQEVIHRLPFVSAPSQTIIPEMEDNWPKEKQAKLLFALHLAKNFIAKVEQKYPGAPNKLAPHEFPTVSGMNKEQRQYLAAACLSLGYKVNYEVDGTHEALLSRGENVTFFKHHNIWSILGDMDKIRGVESLGLSRGITPSPTLFESREAQKAITELEHISPKK